MAGREVPKTQRLMGRETPGPPEPCTLPPDQVEGSAACAFRKDHAEGLSLICCEGLITVIVFERFSNTNDCPVGALLKFVCTYCKYYD